MPIKEAKELTSTTQTNADSKPFANIDVLMQERGAIGLYLKEEELEIPLLTAEEEVDLAKQIEKGIKAREEIVNNPNSNTSKKRQRKLQFAVEDGLAGFEYFIHSNLRLPISVAKKYRGRGLSWSDLIQEGNLGLLRALKKFDYRRGNRFSTHATWWIRQTITRAIADKSPTIRISAHMLNQISDMDKLHDRLTQEFGRNPTDDDLTRQYAEDHDVKEKTAKTIIQAKNIQTVSLEEPLVTAEGKVLGDFIEDKTSPNVEEDFDQALLKELFREIFDDDNLSAEKVTLL
jgi:RNA polymerase primary sigma factor